MACLQTSLTIKGKILEDGWQDFWEFFRFSEKSVPGTVQRWVWNRRFLPFNPCVREVQAGDGQRIGGSA